VLFAALSFQRRKKLRWQTTIEAACSPKPVPSYSLRHRWRQEIQIRSRKKPYANRRTPFRGADCAVPVKLNRVVLGQLGVGWRGPSPDPSRAETTEPPRSDLRPSKSTGHRRASCRAGTAKPQKSKWSSAASRHRATQQHPCRSRPTIRRACRRSMRMAGHLGAAPTLRLLAGTADGRLVGSCQPQRLTRRARP
jgi:hypothetical protein